MATRRVGQGLCSEFGPRISFGFRVSGFGFVFQFVSHSMHRLEPARFVRVRLQFGAQAGDVIIHGARRRKRGVAPNHVKKFFARDRFAFGLGHQPQHGEFLGRQVNPFFAAHGSLPHQVDFDIAQLQCIRRLVVPLKSSQQCSHPGEQFLGAERLNQIIVRAGVEAGDAVLDLPLGGEHEHGHGVGEAAQLGTQRKAIEFRHHDVEQDEVGFFVERALQAALAVHRRQHPIALGGEEVGQRHAHGRFVFDDQDAGHDFLTTDEHGWTRTTGTKCNWHESVEPEDAGFNLRTFA